MEPPRSRVPLLQFGVTSLEEACAASWEDIALPSSLLWTHAPYPSGSPLLRLTPRSGSPCRLLPAPAAGGSFPTLSLRVFPEMPGPLLRRLTGCRRLLLPLPHRPSLDPRRVIGRRTVNTRSSDFPAEDLFEVAAISLCSGLSVCLPPWSLPPHSSLRSRRWRLRPSRTCLVTLTCIGYASRPKQAIDDTGTPTPLKLGRGRDISCPMPPAQTRAGATHAHGSYLGCWASKRTPG